jgi:4-hydroxythreonine-4-phosphate dehydrogenase
VKQVLRLALTPGEPAGIGPDLVVQIAQHTSPHQRVVFADPQLLEQRAHQLGMRLRLVEHNPHHVPESDPAGTLRIVPLPLAESARAGELNPANAAYVLECLRQAVTECLDNTCAALVTGPVNKAIINQAGYVFTGHTEFLAELTHTRQVVMLLTAPGLRVALATTHLPLAEVPTAITPESLSQTLDILHQDLRLRFAINAPRIQVLGLNPHAGESGHLGREEIEVIGPVIEAARAAGMCVTGPVPADSAFQPDKLSNTDAVLAMYHDQGLPVLKHVGFGQAVNVTLGLPLIRTSVDHGTALELAGSGRSQTGSLDAAINMAISMASHSLPV